MNIEELNNYLQSLPEEIISDAAEIVAETATEYYKSAFKKKAFDGNPWTPAKVPKTTGSLLIDSGALVNSIRPAVITPQRVVISAGNEKGRLRSGTQRGIQRYSTRTGTHPENKTERCTGQGAHPEN